MGLYTSLVASLVFPLHERLKRHDTVSIRRHMEQAQWWSPERLQAFQLQRGDQSFFATFPKFFVITFVSFGVYLFFSRLLKLKEADPVISKLNSIVFARRF